MWKRVKGGIAIGNKWRIESALCERDITCMCRGHNIFMDERHCWTSQGMEYGKYKGLQKK